ncbi:hypothetical protein [Streptomyces sp. NPDC051567]|uniref:hypothetical protein n=1 Tax=Streptomyces sp. NPDC051567 TaxID=3365660 RepID=UPI00379AA7F6
MSHIGIERTRLPYGEQGDEREEGRGPAVEGGGGERTDRRLTAELTEAVRDFLAAR